MRKFVLFDFDGVIVDSLWLAFGTAQQVHPHFTLEKWLPMFEGNIYANYDHSECTDACKPAQEDYFSIFSSRIGEIVAFSGMPEVVRQLSAKYGLAIVSSSVSMDIVATLKRLGLDAHFADVLGKDVHTSKVEKIHSLLSRYEARADDCVFVTDTLGDMLEAEEAGLDAIGVSWGFLPKERLVQGKPYRVVDTPQELLAAIDEYFARTIAPSSIS
ncbi:MAG: phosphatase [Parcubacteria group bacterium Athens0416_74]|nr:MAG: phosphatase [Parcubacteria group bacterium Athens0416_74]